MALFPMLIDLRGKKCVIFGGGRVAGRKIRSLLRFEADLLVISREISEEIRTALPENACLTMLPDPERLGEILEGAALCVAATSDRDFNHCVSSYCRDKGIPVNVADAPEECTFIFPAVVVRDEISIGIGSAGTSPGMSSMIRREVEKAVPEWMGPAAVSLGELRRQLKEKVADKMLRRQIMDHGLSVISSKKGALTQEEISDMIVLQYERTKKDQANG